MIAETIYLTPECYYSSFIIDNVVCKPLGEDLVFRGVLIIIGLGFFVLLMKGVCERCNQKQ